MAPGNEPPGTNHQGTRSRTCPKTYRVVAWSTGNVGRHAIAGIDARPDLELVGLWVSNPDKVGKDAGELAGLGRTLGVAATDDVEALLALDPDVVVHTAMADHRLMEAIDDMARILRAGVNVVSSGPVFLQYPYGVVDDAMIAPVLEAAVAGGVSLFVNGVDPGFANDALPLVLSGVSERIEEVRVAELLNYATYNQPMVIFDIMGFGRPIDQVPMILQPGVMTMAWGSVVRQLAAGLEVELDSLEEWYERLPATETFEVDSGTIEKGTAAALHFELRGMRNGKGGDRARARHPPARRPGPGMAPARRPGLLPGDHHRRAQLHPRPAAPRDRRRPQHRRAEGHGHAPGQRHPRRGRRGSRPAHRPRPAPGLRTWPGLLTGRGDAWEFRP